MPALPRVTEEMERAAYIRLLDDDDEEGRGNHGFRIHGHEL